MDAKTRNATEMSAETIGIRKRNHQHNIEVALATGAHFCRETVDLGGDRTLVDVLEKFRGLALGASLDL